MTRQQWWKYCLLGISIALVWVLLALPILFYHLPLPGMDAGPQNMTYLNLSSPVLLTNNTCSSPVPYTGTVCFNELQQYTRCLPGSTTESAVMVSRDKSKLEETVASQIEVVKLLTLSNRCVHDAIPLLCGYYFGPLCDEKGWTHRVSKQQCLHISEDACEREWKLAAGYVPDCHSNEFSDETTFKETCDDRNYLHKELSIPVITNHTNCTLVCSMDYFCKPGTQSCTPSCDWKEYREPIDTIINVCVILSACLGIVFTMLTLISAAVRRDRMCKFPSVIVVYQTIAVTVAAFFLLIGFTNKKALYCRDNDLLASLKHPTPFCEISALVTHYCLSFLSLWWICHTIVIFWKLRFPFQAREFEIERKIKYIHLACALFCVLVSFLPLAVIMLVDWRRRQDGEHVMGMLGFGITRYPPLVCTSVSRVTAYYTLILPINVLVPIGVTLLILVVGLIHKNSKLQGTTGKRTINAAQRKVLFVLCYYVLVAAVALTGVTIVSRKGPAFARELLHYFACERIGIDTAHPCDRSRFEQLQHPGLVSASFILVGLFPLVNFIFTTNFSEVKDALRRCCKRSKESGDEESKSLIKTKSAKLSDNENSE